MGVYKRGKYFHYDFVFDGVRYQKSTRTTDAEEAKNIEAAVRGDLARGNVGLPGKSVTFDGLAKQFSEFAEAQRPKSWCTEKYHVQQHLKSYFGKARLLAFANSDVSERYKRWRRRGRKGEKPPEYATINRELVTLKSMLKFAGKRGLAPKGLGKSVELYPGVENKSKPALTEKQVATFLEVCGSFEFSVRVPHLLPLVTLGFYTGLRASPAGELVCLEWDDVDMENRAIVVKKSKTKAGRRPIPLFPLVHEALRRQRTKTHGRWVFPSPRKKGAHILDFGKAFEAAAKKAGLGHLTVGCMRHTFATWLSPNTRDRILIQLMGHSNPKHTRPYDHPDWAELVAAINRLPGAPAGGTLPTPSSAVRAEFTAVPKGPGRAGAFNRGEVVDTKGLEMVGPNGLEPLTSTVSR